MATFDTYVTSITQDEFVPKVTDTILNSNILTLRMLGNSKVWSGENLKFPIKTSTNTSSGSFSGFDVFSTSKANTRNVLQFDPRSSYQSVVIDGMSLSVNATQAQVVDLLKTEMQGASQDFADTIGTQFYSDGTGNSNKDFLGLAAAVDDGTSVATYGGLSRSTVTSIQATKTASGGTLTLAKLATLEDAIKSGTDKPSLIVSDESVWTLYEQLNQPTINNNQNGFAQTTRTGIRQSRSALTGEMGFDTLFYRGTPWVADEKATAQTVFMLNERYLHWYGLKHKMHSQVSLGSSTIDGVYSDVPSVKGMHWTGLKEPVNQDAEIGQFLLFGNMVSNNPRRLGQLTGVTSV